MLVRAVITDATVFGAAWPFGAAAAGPTLLAAVAFARMSHRCVLAGSHLLMAFGCLLPLLHLSPLTVLAASLLAASLLVGGTFMMATMAGIQAARGCARGPDPCARPHDGGLRDRADGGAGAVVAAQRPS